jgi:EAL domain-containing protein (putative c-di-GMP-specific phosphodiesterase class I)
METKPDQTLRTKQRDNPNLKIGGSIKRPKSYLYKKDKDLQTSVNKGEFEISNKKKVENEGVLRKERKMITKKEPELEITENELYEKNEYNKKLLQEFNESCIKVMLSNHMSRNR